MTTAHYSLEPSSFTPLLVVIVPRTITQESVVECPQITNPQPASYNMNLQLASSKCTNRWNLNSPPSLLNKTSRWSFSIRDATQAGRVNNNKKYQGRFDKGPLTKVVQPHFERYFLFHPTNLRSIFSNTSYRLVKIPYIPMIIGLSHI